MTAFEPEDLEQRWTDRLYLRRLVAADEDAVVALESDPATYAHEEPPTAEQARERFAGFLGQWAGDGVGYWAVEVRGTLVGTAGLRFQVWRKRECWNLGYRFSPAVWGRGYATEAALEAVQWSFGHVPRLPVVARTHPDNAAAIAVALGAGLDRHPDLDADGLITLATRW